jgi:hypothetical protein
MLVALKNQTVHVALKNQMEHGVLTRMIVLQGLVRGTHA